MPYHGKVLTDQEKLEIVKLYTGIPKVNINKLATMYHVGAEQITDALKEAGIKRKLNKKREAIGWNPNQKKPRPETYNVTHATEEYMQFIFDMMAEAGRMDGEATKNFERLIKENPFQGTKRTTVTKTRKIALK